MLGSDLCVCVCVCMCVCVCGYVCVREYVRAKERIKERVPLHPYAHVPQNKVNMDKQDKEQVTD